jgi:hypothetical protein
MSTPVKAKENASKNSSDYAKKASLTYGPVVGDFSCDDD